MVGSHSIIFEQEEVKEIIRIGLEFDLNGTDYDQEKVLSLYYDARKLSKWTSFERKTLGPLLAENQDRLLGNLGLKDVCDVLHLKSTLFWIVDDFPQMAESVLYSPLMEELDETIEEWASDLEGDDATIPCLYSAMRERLDILEKNSEHVWWNIQNYISSIDGLPIVEVIAEYRQKLVNETELQQKLDAARTELEEMIEHHEKQGRGRSQENIRIQKKKIERLEKEIEETRAYGSPELDMFW